MSDDEQLRHVLNVAIPPASDADVAQALQRVHLKAEARRQNRATRPWLAGAATAVAVAGIIIIAVVAMGAGSKRTPPPAATGPGVPTTGVWFRHSGGSVTTPSGTVDLAAVWVLRLSTPSTGSLDVRPHDRFGTGTLQYDSATREWTVHVLDRYCGVTDGQYRIARSGRSLVVTAVSDNCTARRDALDQTVFAPLTNPDQLVG